jgi:hypothetical protein
MSYKTRKCAIGICCISRDVLGKGVEKNWRKYGEEIGEKRTYCLLLRDVISTEEMLLS